MTNQQTSPAPGKKIERFRAGGNRTPLSAEAANEIVDNLNPLLNIQITRGDSDRVYYTGDRIILQILTNG